jgi:hypothetical protein
MIRFYRGMLPLASLLLSAGFGAGAEVVDSRTLRESIPLGDPRRLIVDNVHGSIRVSGHGGDAIEMVVEETVRADSRELFDRARREVSLEVTSGERGVVLYVDGPFRDCDCDRRRYRRDPGYRVSHEFELRVPQAIDLELSTVDGEIEVTGVRGSFDVRGVNGGVELSDVAGSGRARTVNGPVNVSFTDNPRKDSDFATVNGEIDVRFREGLSADLRFKTLTGEMFSEFDFRPLPAAPPVQVTRRGMRTIRTDPWSAVRIAAGGPRLTFENVNGTIRVRKNR